MWFGLGLFAICCQGFSSDTQEQPKARIDDLVEQLVSPNKPPTTKNLELATVSFPADYDVESQRRIQKVRQELRDRFEEALPYLIRSLDDKRYCMTTQWGEGPQAYHNRSVGWICDDLLRSQLEVYRNSIGFAGPGHFYEYSYNFFRSDGWWQKRKGHSLAALQIESINWAIEQRKNDTRRKDNLAAEVAALEKLRDGIINSGKPVNGRGMERMTTPAKK